MAVLSVIVPVFNEEATIEQIVQRVLAVALPCQIKLELLLVDDCSTDQSWRRIESLAMQLMPPHARLRMFRQQVNRGKGAAVRRGLAEANGDIMLIQDADLEYDPADYPRLLAPILAGRADVVYGTRFGSGRPRGRLIHYLANRTLTMLSNLATGLRLSDMETCYKTFTRSVAESLRLVSDGFEIEPEMTARIARGGWRVVEVPISYAGRGYPEGKKITWVDGLRAVWTIARNSALP